MSTESKNSKEKIQTEINNELNELLNTGFSDENYDINLRNLIKSISFITKGILGSLSYFEDKTAINKERFLDDIRERCFCIDTLCELTDQKINPNDFVIIQNLIFDQKELNSK